MKYHAITYALITIALTACGGGGGGASPATSAAQVPVTVFPVDSVVTQLATSGATFSGTNVDTAGKATKLTVAYVPGAAGTFTRQQTLTPTGAAGVTTQDAVSFSKAGTLFKVTGWIDSNANPAVITKSAALPATSNVGAKGNLAAGDLFIQNNGINKVDIGLTHKLDYSWTLTAVTDTTADLCLTATNSGDFFASFATDCFRINAAGAITGFKSTLGSHAKGIDSQTIYQ